MDDINYLLRMTLVTRHAAAAMRAGSKDRLLILLLIIVGTLGDHCRYGDPREIQSETHTYMYIHILLRE